MQKQNTHPSALVESSKVGPRCTIEPFAHIYEGAIIGSDCFIGSGAVISDNVTLGDRVTVSGGVHLRPGVRIGDDAFIAHGTSFAVARTRQSADAGTNDSPTVQRGAFIGENATIMPSVNIGAHAIIEPGSVVTRDVPQNAIVSGNPARITGYGNGTQSPPIRSNASLTPEKSLRDLRVRGAQLLPIPLIVDLRGSLVFGEIDKHLPFKPNRFFVVFDVPGEEVRGEHAHHELHEFLICLKGSISVAMDDGESHDEVRLDDPTIGLHIPPKLWRVHYKYSADAVMLSLCSDIYRADDYIRDYEEFRRIVASSREEG
jgi:acetyltransferase-like isoleucine patch superfamily enzyme/dTDP-4-dehydrorhamnose 3,5-epimerase-like enzyme